MAKLIVLLGVCLFLMGCGDKFTTRSNPDAGASGSAGSAGDAGSGGIGGNTGGSAGAGGNLGGSAGDSAGSAGDSGNTGGTGGNTGGTGGLTGGTGGNTGGTGGLTGGTGGSNPCPEITYDAVAALVSQPCGNLFPSGCGTANPVPRSEFISVVISQVPASKLQGYEDPEAPAFSDVPLAYPSFSVIEKAVWLELIPVTPFFQPGNPATTCFAQDTFTKIQALPVIYAVVFQNQPSGNLPSSGGPSTVARMNVYGTGPANHLIQMVRVVNNLGGDFTVPQSTSALEAVVVRCQVPQGGLNYVEYALPLDGSGKTDFTTLDCYNEASGVMELQLQMDPSVSGGGQQARIGIDSGTLPVRGGQAGSPTKTIQ